MTPKQDIALIGDLGLIDLGNKALKALSERGDPGA
jgi:hypothetical protein